MGYSQVSALLDAYFDPEAFGTLPTIPSAPLAHGAQVGVRSMVAGTISHVDENAVAKIRSVESYVGENVAWSALRVGQPIAKTVDVITLCGQIALVHKDKTQLESDVATVQAVISAGLFETERTATRATWHPWRLAVGSIVFSAAAAWMMTHRRA
jgi:hypothetical protein